MWAKVGSALRESMSTALVLLCWPQSVERSELAQQSVLRRILPYAAAALLLFVGTMGANGMIAWYVCAVALGLGVWQLWMRHARLRWTWAMLAAVALYWLSWLVCRPRCGLVSWESGGMRALSRLASERSCGHQEPKPLSVRTGHSRVLSCAGDGSDRPAPDLSSGGTRARMWLGSVAVGTTPCIRGGVVALSSACIPLSAMTRLACRLSC